MKKGKLWSVSAYKVGNFERVYVDLYVLNRMTKYKKLMNKEDRLLLEGLAAKKFAYYKSIFDYDEKNKQELLDYCIDDIKEDIKEIAFGNNNKY